MDTDVVNCNVNPWKTTPSTLAPPTNYPRCFAGIVHHGDNDRESQDNESRASCLHKVSDLKKFCENVLAIFRTVDFEFVYLCSVVMTTRRLPWRRRSDRCTGLTSVS